MEKDRTKYVTWLLRCLNYFFVLEIEFTLKHTSRKFTSLIILGICTSFQANKNPATLINTKPVGEQVNLIMSRFELTISSNEIWKFTIEIKEKIYCKAYRKAKLSSLWTKQYAILDEKFWTWNKWDLKFPKNW